MIKSKVVLKSKKALVIVYKKYNCNKDYFEELDILHKQLYILWDSIEMFTYNVSKRKYILVGRYGKLI